MDADIRPNDLEESRDDVDLDVEASRSAESGGVSSCESFENATIRTRSISMSSDERGEIAGLTEDRHGVELLAKLARASIDKPDELNSVLRVLQQLAATSWPISPAPTMMVFWTYAARGRTKRASDARANVTSTRSRAPRRHELCGAPIAQRR